MTPAARVQAAIEILDAVIASARDNGPPADQLVRDYFRTRRYAGSKDRRAVREHVFAAIRMLGERPENGRSAMLALVGPDLFDGSPHGPSVVGEGEAPAIASYVPAWIESQLSPLLGERDALLERAPLDLRVHAIKGDREALADALGAALTSHSPWGLRLEPDTRIDDHPAYRSGVVEVQDEGSQLVALACAPADGETVLDLCAGAGGKSLALAAMAPGARIIASDVNRQRLSQFAPRAERAGAEIEALLLDPPRELEGLMDLHGQCDLVLVDAPCSGSGTWRRNPEGRWRLTPERLDKLTELQDRVLDLAAPCVSPGGRLVFATCSILTREGADRIDAFLSRHSDFVSEDALPDVGRKAGQGRLLTPGHDGTDGFFVARLRRSC
ncbi:RsmB/NOP family class I SAM-dependent RNA methyltransferase [Sphingomicrobium clamense]|uniref:RsmB/NOP family class I SAM-dependent RNA methyltransferase n=1 Tax=Sphingomicrobium clamense TaxID=2851013 RepID=A0ABS6V5X8_9SPHN|nr:RsmB/NOP family class I SAM-dependent RNA methyltransferase [Sphingomicrobium sp. B8]MBW0144977.1 RsmB/NOP family class I SAM-dependent RNA methyltransferase [Sphingomicrobium sp. B8]